MSDKDFLREAYKDGAAALFHLKNMWDMIPKLFEVSDITVQVQGQAKEIAPLKAILPEADFFEAISGFWLRIRVLISSTKLIKRIWVREVTTDI